MLSRVRHAVPFRCGVTDSEQRTAWNLLAVARELPVRFVCEAFGADSFAEEIFRAFGFYFFEEIDAIASDAAFVEAVYAGETAPS